MTYSRTWGAQETGNLEDLERVARERPLDGNEKARANALAMYADTEDHRARAQRVVDSQPQGEKFDPKAHFYGQHPDRKNGGR